MIKRENLEKYVEALLNKEISREKLAQQLHIDLRYLSALIAELQEINPELYAKYIKQYPYKPKEVTHIDYEAVVIQMLKERMTTAEVVKRYKDIGLSERTLRRKINEMEKTNYDLFWLYKKLAFLNRGQITLTEKQAFEFDSAIDKLESKPILLGNPTDTRKNELEKLETQFLELKQQGLTNEDAAKQMDTTFTVLYKKFADLKRIRAEENFRESLKVEKQPTVEQNAKDTAQIEQNTHNQEEEIQM